MPLITSNDFKDVYIKLAQRGGSFIWSKLALNSKKRTLSAFNNSAVNHANWWIIPAVKERWNYLITGCKTQEYKAYIMETFFAERQNLRLLSIGSGYCQHELELARYPQFTEITCVDIAENRLREAAQKAREQGLTNLRFHTADFYNFNPTAEYYDVVYFHQALHHVKNVEQWLLQKIKPALKPGGSIVLNEYVGPNRLQYPPAQVAAINAALRLIPRPYRQIFKTGLYKKHFSGSGRWRMYLADPSECVDSAAIIPALHRNFEMVMEKSYGGNLLMGTLKDVAHHFTVLNPQKEAVLHKLFAAEDRYLQLHPGDFRVGIYRKVKNKNTPPQTAPNKAADAGKM